MNDGPTFVWQCQPRSWQFSCVIAASMLGLLAGCDFIKPTTSPPHQDFLRVETKTATLVEQITVTDIYLGKLTPTRNARLSFAEAGVVSSVAANLGDQAAAGALLASIARPGLQQQITQLQEYIAGLQQNVTASPPAETAEINQQIQSRQKQLAELERQLGATRIFAPYDCLIAQRGVNEGDAVSPAVAAFQVIEDRQPEIETQLPRQVVRRLEQGATMRVITGGAPYQVKLLRRSPQVTASTSVQTVLGFRDTLPRRLWEFGSVVELQMVSQQKTSGFQVPVSALVSPGDGIWSVMVAEAGEDGASRIVRRIITVLQTEEDVALVSGSLTQGEAVVVSGAHRVVPGQQVRTDKAPAAVQEPTE